MKLLHTALPAAALLAAAFAVQAAPSEPSVAPPVAPPVEIPRRIVLLVDEIKPFGTCRSWWRSASAISTATAPR